MQFKKCTSLFLAILLLVSNLGLAFNVHYCGDKIASFSSAFSTIQNYESQESFQSDCCCVRQYQGEDSCCKDEVIDLKKESKDELIKTLLFQIDAPFVLVKSTEFLFAKAEKITSKNNITAYYCSPNAPPLFKLYKQYIFYA
jgi:hypothetical protein